MSLTNLSFLLYYKRVLQNMKSSHCRDIFLYLSAMQPLNIRMLQTDKYKNMSLQA